VGSADAARAGSARHLGFGRIATSETEAPDMLANLVQRGWAVA
jgi:hypothetical protein